TDVVADRVEFLESRSEGQYQNSNNPMNQDNGFGDMNQDRSYNNSNNFQQNNNQNMNNNDDFFDDDFTEIEDDGRIPF
ncbi:MAG: single-stranded DNA-binding protein, partial [Anaerococcus hydrogenalis]|nr:single-stranded DNA-binding protein [Anaerococcus hydrogenalis]